MPVVNGTDWLLWANVSAVPTLLAAQRDLSISENTEPIDFSTKDSRNMVAQGGRYSSEIVMEAAYVPSDAAYGELLARVRDGATATIRTKNAGVNDEEATVVVTSVERNYPDQGASSVSITMLVTGAWAAAV